MAKKKLLKKSEARIIVYLNQVDIKLRYAMNIAAKLDMDYGYLSKIINAMLIKGWLKTAKGLSTNKVFYTLSASGNNLVEQAKSLLQGD